jgi:N-acetylneuraminate synthase
VEIVAEIGSVHDGSFGNALKLIELAATSGATVAKFQLHIPEVESTVDAPSPSYFENESRYSYFQRTKFDLNQWGILREHCHKNGIKFGCSAFSIESVDMLAKIGVDVIKIPSGEVSNVPLLRYLSSLKLGIPIPYFFRNEYLA